MIVGQVDLGVAEMEATSLCKLALRGRGTLWTEEQRHCRSIIISSYQTPSKTTGQALYFAVKMKTGVKGAPAFGGLGMGRKTRAQTLTRPEGDGQRR